MLVVEAEWSFVVYSSFRFRHACRAFPFSAKYYATLDSCSLQDFSATRSKFNNFGSIIFLQAPKLLHRGQVTQ